MREIFKKFFFLDVATKQSYLLMIVIGVVAAAVHVSDLGDYLSKRVNRTLDFQVRAALERAPELDPRIKVFGLDDYSVSVLNSYELRISEWAKILEAVAARKPKVIFLDKLFSLPVGKRFGEALGEDEAKEFVKLIQSLGVPVIASGFTTRYRNRYRDQIDTSVEQYSLPAMLREGVHLRDLDWLGEHNKFFYGPLASLVDAFDYIGVIDIAGFGEVKGILRLGPDTAVNYASLQALGEPISVGSDGLYVGHQRIPLDQSGDLVVNFSNSETYYRDINSIAYLLWQIQEKEPIEQVNEGDYVAIIPYMYTGNSDYEATPVGKIHGGMIHLAVFNSYLTGNWLSKYSLTWITLVLLLFITFWIGQLKSMVATAVTLAIVLLMICGSGIAAFSYFGVVVPWIELALYAAANCAAIIGFRYYRLQNVTKRLKGALTGLVDPETIDQLREMPRIISEEPSEHVVTVMFLDIVRFSKASEINTPIDAFKKLKATVALITSIIHEFGGTVDRTMGDGLLCFFGYNYVTNTVIPNHADRAVECGAAIQQRLVTTQLENDSPRTFQALRIGINTCSVFIGNLGDVNRVDVTLIGSGVNFASRLETAAESFMVMIGSTSRELLTNPRYRTMLHKRLLQIKNEEEMFEAYELDVFTDTPDIKNRAIKAFRDQFDLQRTTERILLKDQHSLFLTSQHGNAEVVNLSQGGVSVEMDQYLARGVRYRTELGSSDMNVQLDIDDLGLHYVTVTVRWGKPFIRDGEVRYLHGLQFETLSEKQRVGLMKVCRHLLVDSGKAPPVNNVTNLKSA